MNNQEKTENNNKNKMHVMIWKQGRR